MRISEHFKSFTTLGQKSSENFGALKSRGTDCSLGSAQIYSVDVLLISFDLRPTFTIPYPISRVLIAVY